MQHVPVLLLLLFVMECATSNVPERERTRTFDASADAGFEATLTYLQNEGYEVSTQYKPSDTLPEGQIATSVNTQGDLRDKITCVLRSRGAGATEVIDISMFGHRSKDLATLAHVPTDYVVTVCDVAQEACPYVPARIRVLHKSFPAPSAGGTTEAEKRASFRRVRDEIKTWLDMVFVSDLPHTESKTF